MTITQGVESRSSSHDHHIRQPVFLAVTEAASSTWDEIFNQWVQPLQVLLWLVTAKAASVEELMVQLPLDGTNQTRWAQLWIPMVEPDDQELDKALHPAEIVFFADEFPGDIGATLDRWFEVWGRLKHILGPCHARVIAPFTYANDRFYTAVAALEAYHRYCVTSSRDKPKAEHRLRVGRVDGILAEHAPELREWAVNAVRDFNRVPLWRRIVDVGETMPEVSKALFGGHLEGFARSAESTRIGYAHALPEQRSFEEGLDLYAAADALLWLLRAAVLVDLGVRIDKVESRITAHPSFYETVRHLESIRAQLGGSE